MKRVAIFRSDLLKVSETFIYEQARALTSWQPILLGFRDVPGGLQVPDVSRAIVPGGNKLFRTLRFWLGRPVPALVMLLKEQKVDLVHVHFGTDATDIWPSVRLLRLPMVVTLHGYDINIHRDWWEAGREGIRRRVYPARLLQMARDPKVSFIAVSKAIKSRAIEYGIPEGKITVAYIGVDVGRFKSGPIRLSQRPKRILFVGRMVEKKAPLLMVAAFAEVSKEIPSAELVMVGDGPLKAAAESVARDLQVSVNFLGALSPDQVLQQMHEARILCLPSTKAHKGDAEGLPISILEAQACGIPVVTTMHSGNIEALKPDISGYIVPENDMHSLAKVIAKILEDDNLLTSMGEAAIEFVHETFNIRTKILEVESIYEKNNYK